MRGNGGPSQRWSDNHGRGQASGHKTVGATRVARYRIGVESIRRQAEIPSAFSGAKLLLFLDDAIAVMLRDDKPGIPFPGLWDFPGGGREGDETPQDCILRETEEEIGIKLANTDLVWSRSFEGPAHVTWLFAAHLSHCMSDRLSLGEEGQRLELMTPAQYIGHPQNIPHLADRLRLYLSQNGGFS